MALHVMISVCKIFTTSLICNVVLALKSKTMIYENDIASNTYPNNEILKSGI